MNYLIFYFSPKPLDPGIPIPCAVPDYFLVAVSTRRNLELCIEYSHAGFPSTSTGPWPFEDISPGDQLSFLYGARVRNIYEVVSKAAYTEPERLPPSWEPIYFRGISRYGGKEGAVAPYFPFRLFLRQIGEFDEPIIRSEFAYFAEGLLWRGGYGKSHFQGDELSRQNVLRLAHPVSASEKPRLELSAPSFTPRYSRSRERLEGVFKFDEKLLQAAIRHHLKRNRESMYSLLDLIGLSDWRNRELEVLGERAIARGSPDLIIKERCLEGPSREVVGEVKLNSAKVEDINQLASYLDEVGDRAASGFIVSSSFPKAVMSELSRYPKIHPLIYEHADFGDRGLSFEEIVASMKLVGR